MLELISLIVFVWLLVKALGLAFRITWGAARVVASILMALAVPLLVVCLLFAGGIALIVPVAVVGIALGILKLCCS